MYECKTFTEKIDTWLFGSIDISKSDFYKKAFDLNKNYNVWYFNRLYVPPQIRNKGVASRLMEKLIIYLDQNEIELICEINPYGDLDYEQLKAFYMKYGFVTLKDETLIRYHK